MTVVLIGRFLRRITPREGWLIWLLALALALLTPLAAGEAGWVPGIGLALGLVALAGFLASFGLARWARPARVDGRPSGRGSLPAWLALALAVVAGLVVVSLVVGWGEAQTPPEGASWLARLALRPGLALSEMARRLAYWVHDVRAGGVTQDDAVFLWLLGLVVWAAVAWAGWTLFRAGNALAAYLPAGLLLATNAYFYWDGRLWLPFFFGGLTVLIVLVERYTAEQRWLREGKDFSRDVKFEVLAMAGGLAFLVALASALMARVVVQPAADWFEGLTAAPMARIEDAGGSLFPGLRRAPSSLLASGGGSGGLPRAFLLTSGPELGHELVMLVSTSDLDALVSGQEPDAAMRPYWRALTYDIYTGRGWRNSPVQQERRRSGEAWAEEMPESSRLLRQRVELARGGDRAYFAAGEPLAVNRPYETLVRVGADNPLLELVAVTGSGRRYEVLSATPALDEATLRAAGDAYPAAIADRYLALPGIPDRVSEAARAAVAGAQTPYDQALALQEYLRGFPYSLEIGAPPPERDVADYFLFDLQAGYCDYYATAMVVMARSLGIPARLAVGYATGDYDADQRAFVVREDMAHSWPELYFPGAGWIPFEPTPGRAAAAWSSPSGPPAFPTDQAGLMSGEIQAFSQEAPGRPALWLAGLVALALAAGVAVGLHRRRTPKPLEAIYESLGRWGGRLGRRPGSGETPGEYGRSLAQVVAANQPGTDDLSAEPVMAFVHLYEQSLYGPPRPQDEPLVRRSWGALRKHLRSVWLRRKARLN